MVQGNGFIYVPVLIGGRANEVTNRVMTKGRVYLNGSGGGTILSMYEEEMPALIAALQEVYEHTEHAKTHQAKQDMATTIDVMANAIRNLSDRVADLESRQETHFNV